MLALAVGQAVDDDADGHAEELVDAAHPLGVAAGQVVVDGDDVDALARRARSGRPGSVATSVLPSPVFISAMPPRCRTMPPMSCTSKWRIAEHAPARLAADGERLGQEVVERLALVEPASELGGHRPQLGVGLGLHGRPRAS